MWKERNKQRRRPVLAYFKKKLYKENNTRMNSLENIATRMTLTYIALDSMHIKRKIIVDMVYDKYHYVILE